VYSDNIVSLMLYFTCVLLGVLLFFIFVYICSPLTGYIKIKEVHCIFFNFGVKRDEM